MITTSLLLLANTQDVVVEDINLDGQLDIILDVKDNLTDVPVGISLVVMEKKQSTWQEGSRISLGQKPIFWQIHQGIWGITAAGLVDLQTQQKHISQSTWLEGLSKSTPKKAQFVYDINHDGVVELFLVDSAGTWVQSQNGTKWGSIRPSAEGSLREYSKTGGVQLEVAKRSQPMVVGDVNADGLDDILFLDSAKAQIYYTAQGVVGQRSTVVSLPINVEEQFGQKQRSNNQKKELNWVEFTDINRDGTLDMLWQYWVTGESWFGATAELGWSLGTGTGFGSAHSMALDKAVVDVRTHDVDGDGDQDIVLLSTDLGVASISKAVLSKTVSSNMTVLSFGNGTFTMLPSFKHSFSIPVDAENAFDYMWISDKNGDGFADVLSMEGNTLQLWYASLAGLSKQESQTLEHRGNFVRSCHQTCVDDRIVVWDNRGQTDKATVIEWR